MLALNRASTLIGAALLCVAVTGCGKSTSKSSSNESSQATTQKPNPDTEQPEPSPIHISSGNMKEVASYTMVSIILGDTSSSALDSAVNTSRAQYSQIVAAPTGIVLNLNDIPCPVSGDFTLNAELKNSSDQIQLDFQNQLNMSLMTEFDACNQGITALDGSIHLDFGIFVSDLINYDRFNFHTSIWSDALTIDQYGYLPFSLSGYFDYLIVSEDGVNVKTSIKTDNSAFFAEDVYQLQYFESVKDVDNSTGQYSFSTNGHLIQSADTLNSIEYQTLRPLTGTGFALPDDGIVVVIGDDQTLFLDVLDQQNVKLSLDLANDGSIDHEELTTWDDLVISKIAFYP